VLCAPRCAQQRGNRGGPASTSGTPDQAHAAAADGALRAYSGEDPAWLGLAQVFYVMLPGSQQPSFRVAVGEADTRAWLAWEVRNPLPSCLLPLASCLLPLASCLLPLASCLLPLASCLLPLASCLLPAAALLHETLAVCFALSSLSRAFSS
jgi:hypothetical protein